MIPLACTVVWRPTTVQFLSRQPTRQIHNSGVSDSMVNFLSRTNNVLLLCVNLAFTVLRHGKGSIYCTRCNGCLVFNLYAHWVPATLLSIIAIECGGSCSMFFFSGSFLLCCKLLPSQRLKLTSFQGRTLCCWKATWSSIRQGIVQPPTLVMGSKAPLPRKL